MAEMMTGGCQCGQVRYEVRVDDLDAYLCHCRLCQRATGGVAAALKQVPRGGHLDARAGSVSIVADRPAGVLRPLRLAPDL